MSTDGRLAGYGWTSNPRNDGNPYAGQDYYPYRPVILLHQTVSMGLSQSYVSTHSVPPHLWANPYTGDRWQTVELDRAAYALYQPQYGYHWTNKHDYMLQTEIVGVPVVSQPTYTPTQDRWIGEQIIAPQAAWLRARGLPIDLNSVRYHADTSGSASDTWPGRFSEQDMADYNGICCHIDAWANDHWDCSAERTYDWARYAREALNDGGDVTYTYTADRLDLVAYNADGSIWHKWFDSNVGAWLPGDHHSGGWEQLGLGLPGFDPQTMGAASPPTSAWYGDQFHVYWVQRDANVRWLIWTAESGWRHDWIAGPVSAVSLAARHKLVAS
jgi:hypothetical protein